MRNMYPERVAKALQRAKANIHAGHPELALPDLERAVAKVPKGFDAWFLLGQAKILLNDYGDAETCLKKATHYDPADAGAWFNLGVTYSARGQFAEAIPCYTRAAQYAKTAPVDAIHNLGSCLMSLARFDEAASTFEVLVGLHGGADGQVLLGMAYQGGGHVEKAAAAFSHALDRDMDNYTVNMGLSTCRFMQGDIARAMHFAGRALALKAGDADALAMIERCRLG
ncbi:MAG: tetratricopeptide repeat protein [Telluria sp.]|nr:tetratricopeptide repeat protein [Telluria sp.]